jgi:hypothetical protein
VGIALRQNVRHLPELATFDAYEATIIFIKTAVFADARLFMEIDAWG